MLLLVAGTTGILYLFGLDGPNGVLGDSFIKQDIVAATNVTTIDGDNVFTDILNCRSDLAAPNIFTDNLTVRRSWKCYARRWCCNWGSTNRYTSDNF